MYSYYAGACPPHHHPRVHFSLLRSHKAASSIVGIRCGCECESSSLPPSLPPSSHAASRPTTPFHLSSSSLISLPPSFGRLSPHLLLLRLPPPTPPPPSPPAPLCQCAQLPLLFLHCLPPSVRLSCTSERERERDRCSSSTPTHTEQVVVVVVIVQTTLLPFPPSLPRWWCWLLCCLRCAACTHLIRKGGEQ